MHKLKLYFFFLCTFLPLFFLSQNISADQSKEPISVYLTWEGDPTTTMTVRWITSNTETRSGLQYRQGGYPDWESVESSFIPMPDDHPYHIHRAEIIGLNPDSDYFFRLDEDGTNYKFRTMPERLDQPIRFVEGGDMLHDDPKYLADTNRRSAMEDPHFAVLGGDIAYSAPRLSLYSENFKNWLVWLKTWKETMVTPKGFLIPMLITIGNHEVIGRYGQPPEKAKFFYALFRNPKAESFQVIDFSNYLSIFLLDSDHTSAIDLEQKSWLEENLEPRRNTTHKFAVYHVPAFPSVRKYKGKVSTQVREHWVPLFEEYGINAAFEHHDHVYKRTKPIYQGKVDPEKGILYLGDGAWGIKKPRTPKKPKSTWYLEKTQGSRHFILVTLYGSHRFFMAIDGEGVIFDYAKN
ncbi:MAG: metallophosphoesterase family protein [Chlamydiota bacterium]|nr:metallophosphoesterase family protein [Chlamydiota bacterium]